MTFFDASVIRIESPTGTRVNATNTPPLTLELSHRGGGSARE